MTPAGSRRRPGRRIALALEILATYVQARWWMHRESLPIALGRLRAAGRIRRPRAPGPGGYASAVTRTLRLLPTDSRCLVTSLVLVRVLARRGVSTTVLIGVRPGSQFAAHAWVEYQGRALLPPGEYGRLAEL